MIELRRGVIPGLVVTAVVFAGIGIALSYFRPFGAVFHKDSVWGPERTVTLLVHGMTMDRESGARTWGHPQQQADGTFQWNGMIGRLQSERLTFGGVIRSRGATMSLPDCLDTYGVATDPKSATVFCLEFSPAANTDGLSYKVLELARCLKSLREFTGCRKVRIVAHSAGGLVARVYLQNALPDVHYDSDIDRLITIGTPHLGSALAAKVGDLLGTRATSLKPNADLIINLNRLELPSDVKFAAIVVRGVAAGGHGAGDAYSHLIDRSTLSGLPIDFRVGGDQVIHVCSQNLRLAQCTRRYEDVTNLPVHGILVRVPDPTPKDRSPLEETVHDVAPYDSNVQDWIVRLLTTDDFWTGLSPADRQIWMDQQARQCVFSSIESEALRQHRLSEVGDVTINQLEPITREPNAATYRFTGVATSRVKFLNVGQAKTQVQGSLALTFDRHGRLLECRADAGKVGGARK